MQISIVTPAYNPGNLILETYNSLENQSFKDFEWIIIDDNSNKYNRKIIENIKKQASFSVNIIRNNKNLGQSKSKNIGISVSRGKYIKFLDADDLLDEEHLKNQFDLLKSCNNKTIVFSPTVNFIEKLENFTLNDSYKSVDIDNISQLRRFLVYPFFSHCGCLFHKNSLQDIGGFDENLITDEDGDLILRFMLNCFLFLPEEKSAYFYRKHNFNSRVSSNDSDEKWLSRLNVCLKIEEMLIGEYESLKEQLAQRLDVIGLSCMQYSDELAEEFFYNAQRVYPSYSIPGSFVVRSIRRLFGNNTYHFLKKIVR